MVPVAFKTVYLFLALVALPQVLAGPACAHRNYGKQDCVKKCKSHWGQGGHYMGQSKWGPVMNSSKSQDPDGVLSTACGMDKTSTSDPGSVPTSSYSVPEGNPSSSNPGYVPTPSVSSPEVPPSPSSSSSSSSHPHPPPSESPTPGPTSTPQPPPPSSTSSSHSKPPPSPTSANNKVSPSPSPSPTTIPKESPTPSVSGSSSIENESLTGHNSFRALHGASPLTWSDDLAAAAKSWVTGCKFEHSGGKVGAFGENLAAGTGDYTATDGINAWNDEAKDYDPANPVYSHFTQVVWKSTTEVGCAIVTCPPGSIFPSTYGDAQFLACEYYPPGNVVGEFDENVQA